MMPLLPVAPKEEAVKVSLWGRAGLHENTGGRSLPASLPQLLHPEGPEMNVLVSRSQTTFLISNPLFKFFL